MSVAGGTRMITACGTGYWFVFFWQPFFFSSVFIDLQHAMRYLPLSLLCVRDLLLGEWCFRAWVCSTVLGLSKVPYPVMVHLEYGIKKDSENWHPETFMLLGRRFSFEKVSWGLVSCFYLFVQRLSQVLSLLFESLSP